ncbi:MAG: FecR domain-containing protein [Chitinophagaceae bacterium]|nr:FecR domain-containing protein [Chitinophagaceae bacterium]
MTQDQNRIIQLLELYAGNKATATETAELFAYIRETETGQPLQERIEALLAEEQPGNQLPVAVNWNKMFAQITGQPMEQEAAIVPMSWYKKHQRKLAVAAVLLLSGGALWLSMRDHSNDPVKEKEIVAITNDLPPGRSGAILQLADGSSIVLDSAGNGLVATQGGAEIRKLPNGELVYKAGKSGNAESMLNTMSTPKGRQFQLSLPDGTKVWLNAGSSITYPVAFTGKTRTVSVKGEVYFDVATKAAQPFRVQTTAGLNIEVLGTAFNINAYEDMGSVNTTLIEGAVKLSATGSSQPATILKPGQELSMNKEDKKMQLNEQADIGKTIAWKNGYFNFEGSNVEEVMKELERWYDVEVVYEGAIPKKEFVGEMNRQLSLATVLKALSGTGINFKLEGKKLTVMQ